MNDLHDPLFLLKKPKTIISAGSNSETIKEAAERILTPHLKKDEEFLIIENNLENTEEIKSLLENSSFPVLILNQVKDFSFEKMKILIEAMSGRGFLIINYNEEIIGQIKEGSPVPVLSFGFEGKSDFYASDIKVNGGINFKINYKGNSVPIWLEKSKWEEKIIEALAVVAVATVFGLNLVEISEALKTPDKA
jgi:UDP-N-acetylmuramyl pentapeptide synthase